MAGKEDNLPRHHARYLISVLWLSLFSISALVTVYSIMGYIVVLRLLGFVCPRMFTGKTPVADRPLPTVTLIIPAFNEAVVLEAKLKNSLEIDYPKELLEILVASDGSTDLTNDIARKFVDRGVQLLEFSKNRGKSSVLNDAVAASHGELLCLCDANVMFEPDAVRRMVQWFADPSIGAVTGDVRLVSDSSDFDTGESLYYRMERQIQILESRIGSTICVDGGMYVVRRELFQPLPPDTILDDFKTSINVLNSGKRLVYDPQAVALETGTPRAIDEFRRRTRLAMGAAQSLRRGDIPTPGRPFQLFSWISHKFLRWFSPLALLILWVSNIMTFELGWPFRAALITQCLFYLLALIACAVPSVRQLRPIRVIFYFVLSQVAITIGMIRGLFSRPKGTWKPTARSLTLPQRTSSLTKGATPPES